MTGTASPALDTFTTMDDAAHRVMERIMGPARDIATKEGAMALLRDTHEQLRTTDTPLDFRRYVRACILEMYTPEEVTAVDTDAVRHIMNVLS